MVKIVEEEELVKVGTILVKLSTRKIFIVTKIEGDHITACLTKNSSRIDTLRTYWVSKTPLPDFPYFVATDQSSAKFPYNLQEIFYCTDVATGWKIVELKNDRVHLECLAESYTLWSPTTEEFIDEIKKKKTICLTKFIK